ncbi:MAG: hypothetical protein K6C34_02465 [Alphaproteobacteria bacterium]|nr:hypothetical protein [Alphaproteobacteria bacterium]
MAITTFSQLEKDVRAKFTGAEAGSDCWNVLTYLRNGLQDFVENLGLNRDNVQIYFDRRNKWSGCIRYRGQSLVWIDCTRYVMHKKAGRYDSQKYAYKTINLLYPTVVVSDSIEEAFEAVGGIADKVQVRADEEKAYIVSLYKKIMADRNEDAYGARILLDKAHKIFYEIKGKITE